MTIHKLTSGTGYTYLTRQVAGGDVQRQRGQSAADYYTAKGNPPGVWVGSGAPLLDLAGQTVTEEQMKHLYGLGQHPDASRIIAAYLEANVTADMGKEQREKVVAAAVKSATLGRPFPEYKALASFESRVADRLEVLEKQANRTPTAAEVGKVKREESARQRAAVAGFDVVFAPVKSAALVWALDEREEVRGAVRQAHEAARDAALELLEEHAAFTRTGSTGQAQIETKGLIAAQFDHFDSRAGDPNLHTHVAVSSKVMGVDGKWRALDARALYATTVAASEFYNTRFETELTARLGVTFEARETRGKKQPVREIAGVPTAFITHFSARRTEIEARYEQLLRTYRADHGRDPSKAVAHKLARQANLDTREGKKAARSLEEMRADWTRSLTEAHGADAVQQVMAAVPTPAQPTEPAAAVEHDFADLADQVIAAVGEERAVWTMWNVRAQAERLVRDLAPADRQQHDAWTTAVVAAALAPQRSVQVTAPALITEPTELQRSDGTSVFEQHAGLRYTSQAVLDAERRVVTAALTPTAVGLSGPFVTAAIDGFESRGKTLDEGQRALVTGFATDPRMVVLGLGPAGSGKTTAMQAYVHVAAQAGQRVIPLGTSAASAAVLAKDLGRPAENLHKFLWEYTDGPAATALQNGGPVPRSRASYVLRPGDVVLVDESGMAGTANVDALVKYAAARGAVVRLLGDYRQLSSVEAGGILRQIHHEAGAYELTELHRFNNKDEAAATLKLRVGNGSGLDFYERNERIVGGSRQAMVDAAYQGWRTDMLAGKTTLISTATNTDVTALSARAREDRVTAGQVEADGVLLADGNRAGRGDWIVTRDNNRKLTTTSGRDFVKNGDAWEVVKRHKDGSLRVRHLDHRGRLTLPADYVAANVQLLYASTVMRSQGGTVDTAHPLVTEDMTREQLYVQLSRAREKTTLYTVTHELLAFDTDEQMDATRHDPDTFAAREVLERVLAREGAQHSATDTIAEAQEEAVSLATLVPRYDHATDTLTRQHYTQLTTTVLGPDLGQNITEDPAFSAVARALRTAQGQGWQPEQLLAAAARQGDLTAADSPAQLLAWRINQHTEDHQAPAHLEQPTAADATRYAALLGLTSTAFTPETATRTPQLLRTVAASGTTPAGNPYVSAADLDRYAAAVAERSNTTAAAVAQHRDWPQLAAVLVAAHQAGHDTNLLLDTAHARTTRSDNPVHHLTTETTELAVQRGIPADEHRVPAALRHQAAAQHALGDHLADQARAEAAWPALAAALRRAETAGHQPGHLLHQAVESRPIDGADSVNLLLAWRINRYLATAPTTDQRTTDRQAEQWRTLAWTLKAAENSGTDLNHALASASGGQLEQLLQHGRVLQDAGATSRRDLPGWVAAPQHHPAMDQAHRTYLDDRAQLIADRMTALAERVTTSRPDWSQSLGHAPADPAARTVWTQHLATIAAYRDQYQVTDDNPAQPAGPYIEQGRHGHTAYWAAAASALAARQLSRTGTVPTSTTPTPDTTARGRLAADVFQTLTPEQQQTVINDIATRTGATWLQHTPVADSAALRFVTVVDPLTTVMTEHGHLTPESRPAPADTTAPSTAEPSAAAEPSLADRRRAGRAAERAAHRDQVQARNGRTVRSNTPTPRPAQPQQSAPRTDRRPEQPPIQQPPRQRPDQQGPRIR
ncbi:MULTISPECIES: MobF family relaxase [Streptacidiphilus]|uniref:MobF family relaxase n=1 Tax=Streptacidiphilus cavernicola TaxID=3342716 RepID=A0ABV6V0A2_9ACTN|nr:MobF family relaxase [Streptacidiphilus jeojiense]